MVVETNNKHACAAGMIENAFNQLGNALFKIVITWAMAIATLDQGFVLFGLSLINGCSFNVQAQMYSRLSPMGHVLRK